LIAGVGVIRLEQMYPLTLGANIGTTMTALMAAMVADTIGSLQVALAHLFFNITGILIWYPIPFMRQVPLNGARQLGRATRLWRGFPLVYIFTVFIIIPMILLGLSAIFVHGGKGWDTLGAFLVILLGAGLIYLGFWCRFRDGKAKCTTCFERRELKRETYETLPEDMAFLKAKISALVDHTGMPEDEEEDEDVEKTAGASTPAVKADTESDENDNISQEIQT